MKKINVTKKAVKVILNITMPLVVFLLGVLLATCLPEKQSTLVRKNQSGGSNQKAIRQLPAVRSFENYLGHIEAKDIEKMWENSSCYRQKAFDDKKDNMMYDYFLTTNYEVQYIIPIGDGNRISLKKNNGDTLRLKKEEDKLNPKVPINEHTFSFYALLRYEDDVCVEGEVDGLKSFRDTKLKICDSAGFEPVFEPVVEEMYEFVNHRFIIDSAECVKNELRGYMLNMSLKDFVIQDWCFPILFARKHQLPPKQEGRNGIALYERLGHSMLSEVVMLEEDGEWKLSRFRTIAVSRW